MFGHAGAVHFAAMSSGLRQIIRSLRSQPYVRTSAETLFKAQG
jgi:hypothetical protein